MKLSTKGRYAVTALADMVLQQDGDQPNALVTLGDIADRQQISLPYLEQLFARLRRAGLVESVRGPGGGYRLSRPADEVRISEIMEAVDETLRAMKCVDEVGDGCGGERAACLTHDLWEQLSSQVYLFLHGVTLADVALKRIVPCNALPSFAALLEEEGVDAVG